MAQFFQQPPNQQQYGGSSAQNLQFYPSSYTPNPVSGHATPSQASYGYGGGVGSPGYGGSASFSSGFGGAQGGVSGRMGEQGGLRTGWLAAFGTEGYDGEPPLLEELGVNFSHIQSKVFLSSPQCLHSLRIRKLTCEIVTLDISSTKPSSTNRPAHHGRFRSRRTYTLLPPLWVLPPVFRKGSFRIYLRSSTIRQHLPPSHPLSNVTTTRHLITHLFNARPSTCAFFANRFLTSIIHTHISSISFSIGVLFATTCDYEFNRCGSEDGRSAGLYPYESCDCVVYVQ